MKSTLFQNEYDIALGICVDGFAPFKRNGKSMTLIMGIICNLPPDIRWENIIIFGVAPGPKKADIFRYLTPLIEELLILESEGDIPGLAELCLNSSHTSKYGCRLYPNEGTGHQQKTHTRKTGMYFPPPEENMEAILLRSVQEY
ncbi:hypothetical protein INT47_002408 [Mucor saturninus]|uniref:Uncharacterized protein n=1 Tax=Mucor saturninus TaxID=64648 RepID=A0A8H7RIW0_9FUNG|nr:hypothetical protein INT47_002408 [Mucor saturninus]